EDASDVTIRGVGRGGVVAVGGLCQPAVSLRDCMNTIRLASLRRIAPMSLALESTMGWHRSIVGCLVGLLLHASTLATMPLAWCVGAHGHNAIELCAGPTCHQGDALPVAMRVQPN